MTELFRRSLLAATALLLVGKVSAQEGRIFPLRGVVANSASKPSLAVRRNAPEVTAFSYRLAAPICSAANGSEFVALEELYLANGEIWFRVSFVKMAASSIGDCPRSGLSGWMIAKFKNNRWGVSILEQGLALASQQIAQPTGVKPDGPSGQEEGNSRRPLLDLMFLIAGTGLGVCIVSIERANSLKGWATRVVAFEFIVLAAINILIAFLLNDQLASVPEPNLMFHVFRIVQGSQGGFVLLGFLLSVILMKFMSFAKQE